MLNAELERVRNQIAELKIEEALLTKMLRRMGDNNAKKPPTNRALGVKSAVLNFAFEAGGEGVTTEEMRDAVERTIPEVAKDTVRSVLSRLKSDGALAFVRGRYYVKEFVPQGEDGPNVTPLRSGQ